MGSLQQPSATASEGIRMLQRGCVALKYGRAGKPHATEFHLSHDGKIFSWKGKRSSLGSKDERKVELKNVAHLLVGRESAVFKRFQDDGRVSGRLGSNWNEDVLEDQESEKAFKRGKPLARS